MGALINNKKPLSLPPPLTLRKFHEQRNKVLINRQTGGAGDILMHRMMFEDFKLIMPQVEIHFSCPRQYHDLVRGHPFVSEVLDYQTVNVYDYLISYNTSAACGRYENAMAPLSGDNRSDIWAAHCGVKLTRHNMHLSVDQESMIFGEQVIKSVRKDETKAAVLMAPISAMVFKDLNPTQLKGLVDGLRMRNCEPFAVHTHPIPFLEAMGVPVIYGLNMKRWMGVVNASDYVVSVDTGAFHLAGGLGKPVVGIFTFADGLVYGKYYPKFELVQKHRKNGDWPCGPCYALGNCPKTTAPVKPCLTEITPGMIMDGVDRLLERFPWDGTHSSRLGVLK
jgi:hypothetical protein